MDNSSYKKHFGLESIKLSLKHFLIGKGINVFLSLSILILLARLMSQSDYAIFVSWQALVVIIGLLSSPGIQAALRRFLPEIRALGNNLLLYRFLSIGLVMRYLLALGMVVLVVTIAPKVSASILYGEAGSLLPWFLLIGSIRIAAITIALAFDSLLWQRLSQIGLVSSNVFRLTAIFLVHSIYGISLESVVLIELGSELVHLSVLLVGYFRIWKSDADKHAGDRLWWPQNRRRVLRYGASKYLANLSKILYGGAPNRLLALQFMPLQEVALFGFTDSLLNLARRFAPVALLLGFIRPVFVAKYTASQDFAFLARMSDIIFRVNTVILMCLIVLLLNLGEPLISMFTNGKYGDASALLVGFFIILIVEGFRLILEMLIEVTELNGISIVSNLLQSFSLLIALPLFSLFGLWAIVIANLVGTVLGTVYCVYRLHQHGYNTDFNVGLMLVIMLNAALAWAAGYWAYQTYQSLVLCALLSLATFFVSTLIFRPLNKQEFGKLLKYMSRSKKTVVS